MERVNGATVDGGRWNGGTVDIMSRLAQTFQDLEVYQEAFRLQQDVFALTKRLPVEERYSLTDQLRRSSRAIGANIAESWVKRRYPAHFLSKLTDADGELQETSHWLASLASCSYVDESEIDR
jgi:four helix bundle protein